MNPVDLLVHQQRVSRVMLEAIPDAPQVSQPLRRHRVRRLAAGLTRHLGVRLIRASQRLQPPLESQPSRGLRPAALPPVPKLQRG